MEVSYPCYYAPRGRDSSYFGLFSALRAVWLCFFFPQGLFGLKKFSFYSSLGAVWTEKKNFYNSLGIFV